MPGSARRATPLSRWKRAPMPSWSIPPSLRPKTRAQWPKPWPWPSMPDARPGWPGVFRSSPTRRRAVRPRILSPDRFSADRLHLYLVADPDHTATDFEAMIAGAVRGGITALQLRAKTWSDRETLAVATWLAQICRDADVLFVINDRVDLAVASAADG